MVGTCAVTAKFLKCKELLASDDRKIEYMRFRDIILEGDFFMDQTRPPYLCSDISDEVKAESSSAAGIRSLARLATTARISSAPLM